MLLGKAVGFSFRLSYLKKKLRLVNVTEFETIRFMAPLTNIKSVYNVATGVFTPPYDGLYHLSLTAMNDRDSELNSLYIKHVTSKGYKKDICAAAILSKNNTDFYQSGSCSTVVVLHQGDQVSVYAFKNSTLFGPYTFFSGFLISKF